MGARSGSGLRGKYSGMQYDYNAGYEKAPFPGAVQIKNIKVGDVLVEGNSQTSKFYTEILKIDKLSRNKILITTKTSGVTQSVIVNPSYYVNGVKV